MTLPTNQILQGDCLKTFKQIPGGSDRAGRKNFGSGMRFWAGVAEPAQEFLRGLKAA